MTTRSQATALQFLAQRVREVQGHDEHGLLVQRRAPAPLRLAVGLGVEHPRGQVELLLQLQRPLLADGCRADHQQPALALRPELAEHDARLDRLPETDLVGQDHALGER